MRDLFRMWWPGVKLIICFLCVSILWSGLGWCYTAIAGGLPPLLFEVLGWVIVAIFFPISLSIAASELRRRTKVRSQSDHVL